MTARSTDGEAVASESVCGRKAANTSAWVAVVGKLMVVETPLSRSCWTGLACAQDVLVGYHAP
ncbi:MAG: hypothetical protein SGJ26_12820 [Nitrospirota bacterium]|nr:hypothetical protein [Nitrospirota bacterium]